MVIRIFNIRQRIRIAPVLLVVAILIAVAGNFMGCEVEDWALAVDCNDCFGYEPDSAKLIVYVTINAENDSVPLTFYRGPYEDGEIDWQDTATDKEFLLFSEMDREYTVRAEYRSGEKTIVVFDADKMYLRNSGDECGSPCYIVKGGIFDLKLIE